MDSQKHEVALKVQEPSPTHVGRNIVTLDRKTKNLLAITSGDIVEIQGTKKTAAVVWPARAEDEGKDIVRMDNLIRHNAGVGLGEKVIVRVANFKEAQKVVLAPTQEVRIIASGYDRILKKTFIGRPVARGDNVWITVLGSGFVYRVVDTTPRGIVKITDFTQFVLKEEPIKGELEGVPKTSYEDIGGLGEQVQKVREMIELPMRHPELFRKLGIDPPKGVLLHGPPGCLTGESIVCLEDGRLVRMEELAGNLVPGVYIADLPVYPPAHAKAIHVYDVPETMELISRSGKRLRMTLNHPVMTERGWIEAQNLEKTDKVKIFSWIPGPLQYIPTGFTGDFKRLRADCRIPPVWSEDLGLLAGIFVAEGSVGGRRIQFAIHRDEAELRKEILRAVNELFGVSCTERLDKVKAVRKMRFSSRVLEDFFKTIWTADKKIPANLMLSPNSVAAAFLKGLFEGDGSVVKKNRWYDRAVTLKSKSRQLMEEVQMVLLRWAVKGNIYTYQSPTGPVYTLKISGRDNLKRYAENIGFISTQKKGKLEEQISNYKRKTPLENSEFEAIKSIQKLNGWQRVYDFEVPTTHAFFSNGILSHNTGKTLLAKAVASETQAHFISVNAPQIMSKFVGEAEERVRQLFKEAEENAPSIIFIDEIDAIAPKREEVIGEVERRVVAQILALMDGLESRGNVIVIAATNRVNSLDEALRRPGRFDREIEIGVPSKKDRYEVLQIHTRGMPLASNVELSHFADITHGFVGADLAALGKEAAMKALRRYLPEINLEEQTIPQEILEKMEVTQNDFNDAMKEIQPSALREVMVEVPNVKWDDIGGLDEVKEQLKQAVEWPLKHPEVFKGMNIRPPKGILLFGPSGSGKTMLAKAIATESEANFISIKGPELLSMWVGESERAVRKLFKKARQVAPVIIFFDEIDSIAGARGMSQSSGVNERVVAQLLTELDGIESTKDIVFIAATNRPDLIDPSLIRPGRIDKLIEVRTPDHEMSRVEVLNIHTANLRLQKDIPRDELLIEIAKNTPSFSGADLMGIVREAGLIAMNRKLILTKEFAEPETFLKHRVNVIKQNLKLKPSKDLVLEELAGKLIAFSDSDVADLVREAELFSQQDAKNGLSELHKRHFDEALKKILGLTDKDRLEFLKEAVKDFRLGKDVTREFIEALAKKTSWFGEADLTELLASAATISAYGSKDVKKGLSLESNSLRSVEIGATQINKAFEEFPLPIRKRDFDNVLKKLVPSSAREETEDIYAEFKKTNSPSKLSYVG